MNHKIPLAQNDPLKVEQVRTVQLGMNPRNPRTHSKKQIGQIAASIRGFGFVNPVLIDEANLVIAGDRRSLWIPPAA